MKLQLFTVIAGLLIFAGCKKDGNDGSGIDGSPTKQAYTVDLSGSYSSAGASTTAIAIRVQKDSKILVLGYQWFIRLEKDGVTVDNTFKPISEIASSSKVESFELQDDGKIVVFGHFVLSSGRRAIIRLNSDGSVDNSFNIPGLNFDYFTRNMDGPGIKAIKILGNGKMVIAGQFEYGNLPATYGVNIARLNTDQSVDYSFTSPVGYGDIYGITNMLPLENGSFLLSGYGAIQLKDGLNYNVIRINADGAYDKSFVYNNGGGGAVIIGDMKELPDGKLLLGGSLSIKYQNSIARFNPDGSVDNGFEEFGSNQDVRALLILADKSILLGSSPNYNLPFKKNYLDYINPVGVEDTTFHPDFTNASTWCLASLDEKTVLAGGNFTFNDKKYSIIRLKKNQ